MDIQYASSAPSMVTLQAFWVSGINKFHNKQKVWARFSPYLILERATFAHVDTDGKFLWAETSEKADGVNDVNDELREWCKRWIEGILFVS